MNCKTTLGALMIAAALASAGRGSAEDGRWTEPRVKLLPISKGLQGMIVRLGDGRLLTVEGGNTIFDKGSKYGAVRTSKDGGKSWSAPRKIYEGPQPGIPSDAGVLLITRDGTLVLVYMDISSYKWGWDDAKSEPHDDVRLDVWSIRSLDEGQTWIDRGKIFDGYCGALTNIIQTSGGQVVVPVQRLLRSPGRHAMCTYASGDDGKTWKRSNIIDLGGVGHHGGAMEGTLGELPDGRLLMLIRTRWGRFWEAFSEDEGLSWRVIQPSRIEACSAPGFLVGLASGRLALLYNPLALGRQELSIAFLAADGKSWSRPVAIARDKGQQLSYPHAFEPTPGELWVMNRWPPNRPPLCLSLREADFATARAPLKIVALGDSTTALRSSIRKVYCRRLAETLSSQGISARVINSGVGGSTTRHARGRFEKDVLAHRPDLVIIMLGANDSAIDVWKDPPATQSRVGKQEYAENLRHFVGTLKARGSKVVLVTPTPFRWTPELKKMYGKPPYDPDDPQGFSKPLAEYAEVVREIAREQGVSLVDLFKAFGDYDRLEGRSVGDLLLDGMHPNDEGHRIMAERMIGEIVKLLAAKGP